MNHIKKYPLVAMWVSIAILNATIGLSWGIEWIDLVSVATVVFCMWSARKAKNDQDAYLQWREQVRELYPELKDHGL